MTEVVTMAAPQRRDIQVVVDPVPVFDTSRFEHMQRVAAIMARSTMIPESLRTTGPRDAKIDLPFEQVLSNCFLVVNQATRWGFDPFAVISCCSVVHGRLAYEGKLVAAVIDAKLGVKLHYHFTGDAVSEAYRVYVSDHPFNDDLISKLKPGFTAPGLRIWDGSVAEWKTTGAGTPWTPKNYRRMLIYRGTRDWTRIYESAVLLGVYTDDELMDLVEDARARRANPVPSLSDRLAAGKGQIAAADGFSRDHVERESAPQTTDEGPAVAGSGETGAGPQAEPASPSPSLSSEHSGETADARTEAPVDDHPAPSTGVQSEDAADHVDADRGGGGGDQSVPSPSLPQGWEITYAAALRRAQRKESLQKLAREFWKQYGGWAAIVGADRETAAAIYTAFEKNFGNKDAIEAELRELI